MEFTRRGSASMAVVLALAALFSAPALAQDARRPDPVVMQGKHLDRLIGEPVDSIQVYAYQGGFRPVPFQIDERMEVRAYNTWTTKVKFLSYAFDSGPKAEPDHDPNFDRDDELVFMAWSAGARAAGGAGPGGAGVCEEITVADPAGGQAGYVYACSGGYSSSAESYVSLVSDDEISAVSYEVGFPAGNPFNFDRLRSKGPGGLGPDIVDRLKWQVEVDMLWGIAGYTLNKNEFEHYLRGVRAGPVRIVKEFESVLESYGSAQIRTYNHVYFYPRHIEYKIHSRGSSNWGKSINRSALVMAIDLNEQARGMRFYSEKNPRGEVVDGRPSPSEVDMDYGPNEWAGVGGGHGSILVHLGLDLFTELHKDLYYTDNDAKGDPVEDEPGMIGKFGYMVREQQKEGFGKFPVRFAVYVDPVEYKPGMEKSLVDMYANPLRVSAQNHDLYANAPSAAPIADEREERPMSTFAAQKETRQASWYIAPQFMYSDLYGFGGGLGYGDNDFMGSGASFWTVALWTERGRASYGFEFSNLRFIEGVEAFRIKVGYDSFPAYPYYGIGNDADRDDLTIYWRTDETLEMTFSKYFGHVYGVDFRVGYRNITIDSGLEPTSGEGTPSIEEHFGTGAELEGARWGPPVYGMDGGNHSGFRLALYRDIRSAKRLPKMGNYQEISVDVVNPALGADYNYARVKLDLRAYWQPKFLNPLPWVDDWLSPRRTLATKFFGSDKERALAGRVVFVHTIADEIEYEGTERLDVPFYDLTTIGGSGSVMGYDSNRFKDNDAFYINLEYRWRWWKFTDLAIFYNTGFVMDNIFVREDWEAQFHGSYGFCTRIHLPPHIIVTFDWAWSDEHAGKDHQSSPF